jgi:pimeloyl-ACP methyl ester carboxylesterase
LGCCQWLQISEKLHICAFIQFEFILKNIPLVLLHGFCEDKSLWSGIMERLDHVPILALDLPGFGEAPLPARPGMDFYAHSVCEALNINAIERCVLVGHSLGGYVALAFAAQYPERLAGISLVHSHPFADTPERLEARERAIQMIRSGKKDLYVSQLFPGLFSPDFLANMPGMVGDVIENGKKQSAEGIINGLLSMMQRADQQDTLQESACPVQFVLGAKDPLIPVPPMLKVACMTATIDVQLLEDVAHMSMYEAPDALSETLEMFWKYCIFKSS